MAHHSAVASVLPDRSPDLPDHLASLVAGEWAVWRPFVLRGTGFPVERLLRMSDPACALVADRLLHAQELAESHYHAAKAALNHFLDTLKQAGNGTEDGRFQQALSMLRHLRQRKLPKFDDVKGGARTALESLAGALAELDHLQTQYEDVFAQSMERQSRVLKAAACDPVFQEAVIWQNPEAFVTGIKPFLEPSTAEIKRNKKHRQHEQLVAIYLQRYCIKNETIGFFGPVAWGKIDFDCPTLELISGPGLIKQRHAYFENWMVDSVAERLSGIPGMKWWIPPRLAPYLRVDEGKLFSIGRPPQPLDALSQAILRLCDGNNLPSDILLAVQETVDQHVGKDGLCGFLQKMVEERTLSWRFALPIEANAELNLRSQLLRVQEPALKQAGIEMLDRLENARRKVAAAAGNAGRLSEALHELDLLFRELTNSPARRKAGATYAGRTLIYEDCQRDLTVRASAEFFRPILPALSILLQALRWFGRAEATAFRSELRHVYDELALAYGRNAVPAAALAMRCGSTLPQSPRLREVERSFKCRWENLLPLHENRTAVQFESARLKQRIDNIFPDAAELSSTERILYYCPDLMVEARAVDAIKRGEALYVLSELHIAWNTLTSVLFVQQHPNSQELVDATNWDCMPQSFKILGSRKRERGTVRTEEGVFCPVDYLLAANEDVAAPSGFTAHPISDLLVVEENNQLRIVTRDRKHSFDILEAFADILFGFLMHKAGWIRSVRHVPRIAIDNLVIQRESWTFAAEELLFPAEKEESRRFLEARKWRKDHGLAQVLFVKTPLETKPFYVDLNSPVYTEILCKMIRRVAAASPVCREIIFSEALPLPENAWLQDASGARYSSELRFALLDLKTRLIQNA
jgi:hypothetical protein